ncbi:hypothetical protein AA313_de0204153 [Arthrobotrys entomopaga]|nr:hypothetical protein AA313_de0204153 [Arthrobotrys entomopaga]
MTNLLNLPTEILSLILYNVACYRGYISKTNASRISLTCRRFHELLLPLLYKDFRIKFSRVRQGSEQFDGYLYPRERLELFTKYGKFAKTFDIRVVSGIGDHDIMSRVCIFQWEPSISAALKELAPSLTNLTSVSIGTEEGFHSDDLFNGISVLLSNCITIRSLKLWFRVLSNVAMFFKPINGLEDIENTSSTNVYARLQDLSILLSRSLRSFNKPGYFELWILELIAKRFHASIKTVKRLEFEIVSNEGTIIARDEQVQYLDLPNLQSLSFYLDDTNITGLDQHITFDREKIIEIKLHQTYRKTGDELLELIGRFSNLEILELDELKAQDSIVRRRGMSRIHRWEFAKRVFLVMPKLKKLIAFTTAEKEEIEKQLGRELMARFKLDLRKAIINGSTVTLSSRWWCY